MMLVILLLVDNAIASLFLYGHDNCLHVNTDILQEVTHDSARPIVLFFTNSSQMSSQLFSTARRMTVELESHAGIDHARAYVVADCSSQLIGLDFSDERVGMDCGVAYVRALMQSVDAFDTHDSFSIKLGHVLAHIDTWYDARDCFIWGSDVSRAWLFWILVVSLCWCIQHHCRRRQ